MFNRYLIPLFLTTTTVLVSTPLVQAARETNAISTQSIAAIAKRTVVRIESNDGGFGSGVIIGRTERGNKNIYTILTAAHVVRNQDRNYQIVSPIVLDSSGERKRIRININQNQNIRFLPKVDLAIVNFESDYTFAIATLGNSDYASEGSPVYVAGFPKPGKAIKRIALQFTGGMISSRLDDADSNAQDWNNGYDLSYTNITRMGMSGGPVLDVAGRVVAIHGQGDRHSPGIDEEVSFGQSRDKTGFNLGIPISTFLKLRPQFRRSLGLRIDNLPVNPDLADLSGTMGTYHPKFAQKFRTRTNAPKLFDVTKVSESIPVEEEIADRH